MLVGWAARVGRVRTAPRTMSGRDEFQIPLAQNVIHAGSKLGTDIDFQVPRTQLHSAAIFQAENKLHLAVPRIRTQHFAELFEPFGAVRRFHHAHGDPLGIATVELIDRDQLIDDQVHFVAATSTIHGAAGD